MINKKTALKSMIGLLLIVLLFHLCILFEFISYEKVWAGKLSSLDEMRVFETISILLNVCLLTTLFFKSKSIDNNTSSKAVDVIIWVFVLVFALNTIGNLFAKTMIEQMLGTAVTFISAVLCWIIVRKGK